MVLASGDIIETGRLSKRETSQKKALPTLEGEIYRGLDQIIDDNQELNQDIYVINNPNNVKSVDNQGTFST